MRFSRHRNTVAIAALTVCFVSLATAIVIIISERLSLAAIEDTRQVDLAGSQQDLRHIGTIAISEGSRRCRYLSFDNATGGFRENGSSTCRDEPPVGNSTRGRMDAIRGAFSGR
jgi:hypothetical protein